MAKGRPADPTRARRGTGNRPAAGEQTAAMARVLPVADELAQREPPGDLSPIAAEAWRVCTTEMAGNRHLREPDLLLLRTYCEAVAVHASASANINEFGLVMHTERGTAVNPLLRVQKDAAATIRQLSDVLGLNPSARIRNGLMEIAGQSMVVDLRERLVARVKGELPS